MPMYRTPRHVAPPLFLRGSLDRVGLPLRAHYSKVGCESDWPGSSRWTPSREPRRRSRFLAHLPRGLATGPVVGDGSGLEPALPSVRRPSGANSGQSLSKSLFRTGGGSRSTSLEARSQTPLSRPQCSRHAVPIASACSLRRARDSPCASRLRSRFRNGRGDQTRSRGVTTLKNPERMTPGIRKERLRRSGPG